jgi:holliday junction DNA helicase RuvB
MDIFDLLGINQILEWGKEKMGIKSSSEEKPQYIPEEVKPVKFSFRPQTFEEYISQNKAKEKVKLTLEVIRTKKPCHFIIFGNAGLGKTTLAGIIANELGCDFNMFIGSNFGIEDVQKFLVKNQDAEKLQILFIDEIHGLDIKTLEYLLPIIEDFKVNNLALRPFILIGASTERFLLSKKCNPFLDRIHCQIQLEDYSAEDIKFILKQYNDQIYKANVDEENYNILSKNVRFVPRIAIAYYDLFMACKNANKVLEINRIIKDGLNDIDIRILEHLNNVNGKAIGEEALSVIANTDRFEYKQIIEPYLIRRGLISRTNRGRILTEAGKIFLQDIKNG